MSFCFKLRLNAQFLLLFSMWDEKEEEERNAYVVSWIEQREIKYEGRSKGKNMHDALIFVEKYFILGFWKCYFYWFYHKKSRDVGTWAKENKRDRE